MAKLLPPARMHLGAGNAVKAVDADNKTVTLASGATVAYESLVSTMPLDILLRMLGKNEWADGLTHSSSHIIGVGIRGACPVAASEPPARSLTRRPPPSTRQAPARTARSAGSISRRTTARFTGAHAPPPLLLALVFSVLLARGLTRLRLPSATVFSLYAKDNCPGEGAKLRTVCMGDGSAPAAGGAAEGGPYWSLMFEVSESFMKKVNQEPTALAGGTWPAVVKECLTGAIAASLLTADAQVVSLYHRRLEHGYPTPSLGRDAVLAQALPWLRARGIWSRGRFGSYKYEVANQDHSLMLGVECADNVMAGSLEVTLSHPNIVNGMRNTQILYNAKQA